MPFAATLGDLSERQAGFIRARVAAVELRMIEEVVELRAELHVVSIPDVIILEERPVPGVGPGSPQVWLAETVGRKRIWRSGNERAGVEPVVQGRMAEHTA